MTNCDLCDAEVIDQMEPCKNCGYNAKLKKIESSDRLRSYHRSLHPKNKDHWFEEVSFKKKLKDLLGCSQNEIAILLEISKAAVSDDLKLASGLKEHPDLIKNYKSKKSAIDATKNYMNTVDYESDLQEYIYREWDNIPFFSEWNIYDKNHLHGKYKAYGEGEMDLLAHHKEKNKWLIVELKRNVVSDNAVLQTLRYMGWVYETLAEKDDEVNGMIIGSGYNDKIDLILKWISNIEIYVYDRLDNNTIHFLSTEEAKSDDFKFTQILRNMSPNQRESLLKTLKYK